MTYITDPMTVTELDLVRWQQPTPLLDFRHPDLQRLIESRGWAKLAPHERIGALYDFVRNEIAFGYNASDNLPASQVLRDAIGHCNTKATLLMALLRGIGISCRLHGFTIDKALQRGAITGWAYWLTPRSILHSWVEVWSGNRWVKLEGFILDRAYLRALQQRFAQHKGPFRGYAVATPDLQCPPVEWVGTDTVIQKDGINQDFGLFDSPDEFYDRYGVNLSWPKRWLFQRLVRHRLNRNLERIRGAVACGAESEAPDDPITARKPNGGRPISA
jgi:transglutaminase-like putative cysteine protease